MADWIGIDSSHLLAGGAGVAFCGEEVANPIADGLDTANSKVWGHSVTHTHWAIFDLGASYNITKVRGRSWVTNADPIDVDVFVSMTNGNWGVAVASGINTWTDTETWQEVDTTDKYGRYVKVEILDTEDVNDYIGWGVENVTGIFDVYYSAFIGVITESATAEDEENGLRVLTAQITEAANAEDEVSCTGIFNAAIAESATAVDVVAGSRIYSVEITEVVEAIATQDSYLFYTEIPPFMEEDLIDPYASGAWLWLAQIVVPTQNTVRIARNTEDVRYACEDFDKFNLQIGEQILSGDGSIPRVTLRTFQDISRKIENIINETEGALGGAVKLIRVNEKWLTSVVSALEADYDLLASQSDSEWCTFTLGIPNPLTQRFPLEDYSSSICPWTSPVLFKGPRCQYAGGDPTCTGTYADCRTKGNAVHWGGELGLSPSVIKEQER